jgi:hypothetical protein
VHFDRVNQAALIKMMILKETEKHAAFAAQQQAPPRHGRTTFM